MVTPPSSLPRSRRPLRVLLWVVGVFVLLLLGTWLLIPPLVKHLLQTNLAAMLNRQVSVERVAFNPLTLEGTLHGVTIAARAGGAPLFTLADLETDLSLASVWHRAPVFDRMRVFQPHLTVVRKEDGSYNVQDLLDDWLGGPPGSPARFSFNNIEVVDGSIDVDDRPVHRQHTVRDLSLGIPFLSSLPYQTTVKVLPRMSARINGSLFVLTGSTTPFAKERDAALDINLDAVSLPEYMAYLPVKLRGQLVSGTLTTRAKLVFTEGASQSRSLWLSGQVTVDHANFQRPDAQPVLAFDQASIHVARLDVLNQQLVIDALALERPSIDVRRLANGEFNLAEPFVEADARPPVARSAVARWRVDVEKARIGGGTMRVSDESVKPAYRTVLSNISAEATDLSSVVDKPAHMRLSFTGDFGTAASAEFDLLPLTLEAKGHVSAQKVSLKRLYPYYAQALDLEVQGGEADVAFDFETGPGERERKLLITVGEATLGDMRLALPGEKAPLVQIPQVRLTGITVDAATHSVGIASLASSNGKLAVRRDADGSFSMARILRTSLATGRSDAKVADGTWTLVIKRAAIDRYAIDVDDRQPTPPVALALRDAAATADNYTNARGKLAAISVHARLGSTGTLRLDGAFSTNPLAARWSVVADKVALPPLQPYIDPLVNVTVTAGTVALNGRVSFGVRDEGSAGQRERLRWKGDVTVSDFAALDKPTTSDLARWKELKLTGVDIDTEPLKVDIGGVALADFFTRVIVYNDASVNLVRLLKPTPRDVPLAMAAPVSVGTPPPLPATPPRPASGNGTRASALLSTFTGNLPLTIGRIEFQRGNVQYSDFYIRPNYSANLKDVNGSVSAMSATLPGNVVIAARIDGNSPVDISGSINPLANELSLDIVGRARDIDLPPLSPYAAKYAGYGITKGKLSFDVSYKLANRKLSANNKVVLDQLTFGARVDSPTATKLPVLLAVALLKDVHGVIDIDLPITGSLDDPEFSVGGLIVRVIVNLLSKAVTAPFALLGAAFGGGEELSYLEFKPGLTALGPGDDAKVDKLAKALTARPSLRVDLRGRIDPGPDAQALRHAQVDAAVRAQKVKALAAAGTPVTDVAAVEVTAAERPALLEAAYKDAPIEGRPRNFFGILKDVPPTDMDAMLYAQATVSGDALAALGTQRALAVKEALVKRGVAAERLFIVTGGERGASSQGSAARVDLTLK